MRAAQQACMGVLSYLRESVCLFAHILQVVVLDGVAYHQGAEGVKVLQGNERTPFMAVTIFSKARSKQVGSGTGYDRKKFVRRCD
jgi:hypothetical protein